MDIQLNWGVPTLRTNGVALLSDEIYGYTITYTCGAITGTVTVPHPNLTTVVTNLGGTCVFRIATIDTDLQTGPFSSPLTVVESIAPPPPPPPTPPPVVTYVPNAPTITTAIETVTVKWTAPTTRINGSALRLNEIASFRLAHKCNDRAEVVTNISGNGLSTTMEGLYGTCSFKVMAIDTAGATSGWSNTHSLLIKLRAPARGGFK
jgi:hypothetical protein